MADKSGAGNEHARSRHVEEYEGMDMNATATGTDFQLYDWQREAIEELTTGSGHVLVVAPTGGVKSLTYQQPAVDLDGIALVITPLVALMADQVAALHQRGIAATYLASNLDSRENQRRTEMALSGQIKLLYISPERLA